MKLLIVDYYGRALALAVRAAQAGHEVRLFICKGSAEQGDGFENLTRVDNWLQHARWADLVVSGGDHMYVRQLGVVRRESAHVFGATYETACLEMNWSVGVDTLRHAGLETAPYRTFDSAKEAAGYVLQHPKPYIVRLAGRSFTTLFPQDAVAILESKLAVATTIVVQDFIQGTEIIVGRFMGEKGCVGPWVEGFKDPELMPGGTASYFTEDSKLGEQLMPEPVMAALINARHTGFVGVRAIIDNEGKVWPMEWTCKMEWPMMCALLGSSDGDPVQWMLDSMYGFDTTIFDNSVGVCVPMRVGHYDELNRPIMGLTRGNMRHVFPIDVMSTGKSTKNVWRVTGPQPVIVTGHGSSVTQALARARKTVAQLSVPGAVAYTAVGERLSGQLPNLHRYGYAEHCHYA